MKILHVISSLNPIFGGPIEGVKLLANSVIKEGHEVEVLVCDSPDSPWLNGLGFTVHAVGPSYFTYAYCPRLVPWLKAHGSSFDAVVVEGLWQYTGVMTRRVLRKLGVPYFVFTHGQLGSWFKSAFPLKHLKKKIYWRLFEYKVLKDAKMVLFTTEEEMHQSKLSFAPYVCNEAVVGYGTVQFSGDKNISRGVFFEAFPELSNKRIMLFLGRLDKQKACDLLIEAFAKIAHRDPALQLVMAGPDKSGWQKDLLVLASQLGVEDRITWTGLLTGDIKWGAYLSAECFVLPSRHESFGVVVAEALSCGVPTLISDKVNIFAEVEAYEAGLISNDDLEGTVLSFQRWLQCPPSQKAKMQENALRCFEENFRIDTVAKRFLTLLSTPDNVNG